MSVVSARWTHIPSSIPDKDLTDRECDGNAIKALLHKPPSWTCKKDQAGIKLQDY